MPRQDSIGAATCMDDTSQDSGAESDDDRERELVAQCIDALQTGGADAVATILAAHPDRAERLRERLARLERIGLLPTTADAAGELPEQLGEFRLMRRLGGGGMGVVYLAEQASLGRTVALKIVRPEQRFFPGARARFRREVEAIARLGDAGIVPIYSVGEERGVDFFAMEYVRGASLANVLAAVHGQDHGRLAGRDVAAVAAAHARVAVPERVPEVFQGSWVQTCCRLVVRMARAAQHAHERGVVHRDLKPSNVMVTPDGRVLLLDFGLASADGAVRITRSGAAVGTLHYMAPEQLRGEATDVRTDVYALGATLHELLAVAAPFAATSEPLLRHQILHGEVLPLRTANRNVPVDVATVVGMAMDRDPARRYDTAEALADDLERFLAHQPVHARPAGLWLRLRRRCQRHPAVATAVALVSIALLLTPLLVRLSRGDVDAQIAAANAQAQANLQNAVAATSRMVAEARSGLQSRTPGLDADRLRQLAQAADLIEALFRDNRGDVSVQRLYVRGIVGIAEVRQMLGQSEAALAAIASAERVWLELRRSPAAPPSTTADGWNLRLVQATTLASLGRFGETAAIWQGLLDETADADLDTAAADLLSVRSTCHNNLSRLLHGDGELERAIAHLEAGLALDARLATAAPSVPQQLDAARSRMNLGILYGDSGRLDEARGCYTALADDLRALRAARPADPEVQRELARCEFALAKVASDGAEVEAAAPLRASALAAMRTLVADFPDRVGYRQELGMMAFESSCQQQLAGDDAAAAHSIDLAIEQHEELLRREPGQPEFGSQLATFQRQRSGLLFRQGKVADAIVLVTVAIERQADIAARRAEDAHHQLQLATLLQELGLYHWQQQQWPQARDALRRAAAAYEVAVARQHTPALDPKRLPKLLTILARAERNCDDVDGILRALTRLQQIQPMPAPRLLEAGRNLRVDDRADFQALVRAAEAAAAGSGR